MPFKSEKQRKWMHKNEPEMAKKWEKEETIREKLKEIIREEIRLLSEKERWPKYLKLLGYDSRKFKKLDRHSHDWYMKKYKGSSDEAEFEQNYLDDLERNITKIRI
jgi:hypothetical protein